MIKNNYTIPDRARHYLGWTLIELVVVLAIIAILATIAYPSYVNQVRKSKRAVAKSALLDIANREEQYFFSYRVYTDDLTIFGYSNPAYVNDESTSTSTIADAVYKITADVTSCGTAPCFILTADPNTGNPKNDQQNDACGAFTLTSSNAKGAAANDCW